MITLDATQINPKHALCHIKIRLIPSRAYSRCIDNFAYAACISPYSKIPNWYTSRPYHFFQGPYIYFTTAKIPLFHLSRCQVEIIRRNSWIWKIFIINKHKVDIMYILQLEWDRFWWNWNSDYKSNLYYINTTFDNFLCRSTVFS